MMNRERAKSNNTVSLQGGNMEFIIKYLKIPKKASTGEKELTKKAEYKSRESL